MLVFNVTGVQMSLQYIGGASQVAQCYTIFLPMQALQVLCLDLEDCLKKEMATRSSILSSWGLQRVGHDLMTVHAHTLS